MSRNISESVNCQEKGIIMVIVKDTNAYLGHNIWEIGGFRVFLT